MITVGIQTAPEFNKKNNISSTKSSMRAAAADGGKKSEAMVAIEIQTEAQEVVMTSMNQNGRGLIELPKSNEDHLFEAKV